MNDDLVNGGPFPGSREKQGRADVEKSLIAEGLSSEGLEVPLWMYEWSFEFFLESKDCMHGSCFSII